MENYDIKFSLCEKIKKYDEYILSKNSSIYNDDDIKVYTIKNKLKKDVCSICNLKPIWNKKHLNLLLDRINNNINDNSLENLRFLCPNCYSQVRNKYKSKIYVKNENITKCIDCGKKIKFKTNKYENIKYKTFRCKSCLDNKIYSC